MLDRDAQSGLALVGEKHPVPGILSSIHKRSDCWSQGRGQVLTAGCRFAFVPPWRILTSGFSPPSVNK